MNEPINATPAPAPETIANQTQIPQDWTTGQEPVPARNQIVKTGNRAEAIARGDVIGSARDAYGREQARGEVTLDSVITLPNKMEVRVRDAEVLGFVRKGANGEYEATAQAAPQPTTPDPAAQREALERAGVYEAEPMAPEAETEYAGLSQGISPELNARIAREWIKGGGVSKQTLADVANTMGGDGNPEAAQARIDRVVNLLGDQAHAALTKRGLNSAQVLEWADKNAKPALDRAMEIQATQRSTKAFEPVVASYLENLDTIAPEGLLKLKTGPDVRIYRSPNDGRILVQDRHATYPWKSAVRNGIVRLGKASK